jgi:hypothetical protein
VNKDWQSEQKALCDRFGSQFIPLPSDARVGIALQTMNQRPLHGLRHPAHGNMSGWYIWGGEYSTDAKFFQVLHARHFPEQFPNLVKFLGLEPGFRFLTDGEYQDIWFDQSLLII